MHLYRDVTRKSQNHCAGELATAADVQPFVEGFLLLARLAPVPEHVRSYAVRPVRFQSGALRTRSAPMFDIFVPIDWPDVGRVSVQIWPTDPELLAVHVNPLPQLLTCGRSL